MPETVCRMFATRAIADAAAEELRVNGFANVHVFGGAASSDADGYTDQLCQVYVLKAAAQGTQHNGGKVTNGQGFTDLFNNNRAIFF